MQFLLMAMILSQPLPLPPGQIEPLTLPPGTELAMAQDNPSANPEAIELDPLPIPSKWNVPKRSPFAKRPEWMPAPGVAATQPPFLPRPGVNVDRSTNAAGRWPERLPFPKNAVRYTSTPNTQESFRRWSGYIHAVPRSRIDAKWSVPGNLLGVRGWQSDLYRVLPQQPRGWLGPLAEYLSVQTHQVSYPDGTEFYDVLSNALSGKVFEVRVAEKIKGQWHRSVMFKDPDARPRGYVPFRSMSQCAECHDKAGIGDYGGVMNPGGDTILSFPLPTLERFPFHQGGDIQ